MFRLIGFCIGSLASLGVLFIVIGTPEFHLGDEAADRARFDEAVEKLKSRSASRPVPETDVPMVVNPPPLPVADLPAAIVEPETGALPVDPPPLADLQQVAELPPDDDVREAVVVESVDLQIANARSEWHSFWTPFRTRIAAEGFVGRLENVTGLDYRVVGAAKDGYVVEFSYGDDTELDSKLERISAATGLELSRSLP